MNPGPSDESWKIDTITRFSSIGGLKEHISCLRETIIFPLMYPEVFKKFNIRPAKGILFHGPPGTGKTLLAHALANECSSLVGGRRISFFMGADILRMPMLLETAEKMQPAIIFLDRLDELTPCRTNINNKFSRVINILMAGMRGDLIVIGATNRPEAIDPLVGGAGCFDRELYFPPPEEEDRRDILQIYTRNWDPSLSDETLDHIAKITVGYWAADIKELCSEAVFEALKRAVFDTKNVEVTKDDMLKAMALITPTGGDYAPDVARPLPPHTIPLLDAQLMEAAELLKRTSGLADDQIISNNKCNKEKNDLGSAPSLFLVTGECAESLLAPALLAQLEHCLVEELSVSTLLDADDLSPVKVVESLLAECRGSDCDCVIFIRDLQAVYDVLKTWNGHAVFQKLCEESVGENTLLLATVNSRYSQLSEDVKMMLQEAFPSYKDCIYRVRRPTEAEVTNFLQPVITVLPLVPPIVYQYVLPPPLPRAPTGPLENKQDIEDKKLRLIRRSLMKICRNLLADRRFKRFFTPAQLPDYFSVVKNPMDIATIMYKIENKENFCAKDFLDDIDLIYGNALLYDEAKPDKKDKKFRQEACALHYDAHTMVAKEIPAALELECQLIARRRRESGDDDDEPESDGRESFNKLKSHKQHPCLKRHNLGIKESLAKRPRLSLQNNIEHSLVIKDSVDEINSKFKSILVNTTTTSKYGLPKVNPLLINAAELGEILKKNVNSLSVISLEALIDLHREIRTTVYGYLHLSDRNRLPDELDAIIAKYVHPQNT